MNQNIYVTADCKVSWTDGFARGLAIYPHGENEPCIRLYFSAVKDLEKLSSAADAMLFDWVYETQENDAQELFEAVQEMADEDLTCAKDGD